VTAPELVPDIAPARPVAENVPPVPEPAAVPASHPRAGAALRGSPAYVGVRACALARCGDIRRAYRHFLDGDAEGLHDVRVGLRRLRSWLRAFQPWVDDTFRKKTRRALRSLARATSDARDAEVAAEWVASQTDFADRERSGVRTALARLERERDDETHTVRRRLAADLPSLLDALEKDLELHRDHLPHPAGSMDEAAWPVLQELAARLMQALEHVTDSSALEPAHRARIASKRLRYVLEPLHEPGEARAQLAPLIQLQDLVGAARDAHVLARKYVKEVGETAAQDARERALVSIGVREKPRHRSSARLRVGLIALAKRAHAVEAESFAEFQRLWAPEPAAHTIEALIAPFRPGTTA